MKLRLTGPESQSRDMEIIAEPQSIGRSADCDLVIPDPTISRQHCQVRLAGETIVVEDLGSRYGTAIGGEVFQGAEVQLLPGAELEVGCWSGGLVDDASGEVSSLPTVDMEMTVAQTPSSTRKTRLLKTPDKQHSRGYLLLLFALAAVGGVVLAYILLDTL